MGFFLRFGPVYSLHTPAIEKSARPVVHGLWPQNGNYGTSDCDKPDNAADPRRIYPCNLVLVGNFPLSFLGWDFFLGVLKNVKGGLGGRYLYIHKYNHYLIRSIYTAYIPGIYILPSFGGYFIPSTYHHVTRRIQENSEFWVVFHI